MPRPTRPEFPGGLYHVMNRGVDHGPIVRDDKDRWNWFDLLARSAQRYEWQVFAYVLLDNHFHLYLRLRHANLSDGMHDWESVFARSFNERHERDGALFRGRFQSLLVESDSYSWELSRYLHLNSHRAGICADPFGYKWSSYRHYLNPHQAPEWLDWRTVLAEFSQREAAARVAYKRFVEAGIRQPPPRPWDRAIDGWVLGSEEFANEMRTRFAHDDARTAPPQATLEDVLLAVAETWNVDREFLVTAGRRLNQTSDAAVLLAREVTASTLVEIGAVFGVRDSGVSETLRRAAERLAKNAMFAERVAAARVRHFELQTPPATTWIAAER